MVDLPLLKDRAKNNTPMQAARYIQKPALIFALLLSVVLIAYSHALPVGFLSDDFSILGKLVFEHSTGFSKNFFRPVTIASLWLDSQFFSLQPQYFRAINLLLHAGNTFLVFILTQQLLAILLNSDTKNFKIALISALCFAILPTHSESVIWIAARGDLLATLFCLLTILYYLKWLDIKNNKLLFPVICFFLLALFSKESAFALPILIFAIHSTLIFLKEHKPSQRQSVTIFVLTTISLLFYLFSRKLMIGEFIGGVYRTISPVDYFENTIIYIAKAFSVPMIPYTKSHNIANHILPFGISLILSICAILFFCRKHRITLTLLIVLILASLSPILHRSVSLHLITGERYLYLASVFSCIFIGYCISLVRNQKAITLIISIFLIFANYNLQKSINLWRTSSQIAEQSMEEIQKTHIKGENFIIAGLPAFYHGVHIFHQGFPRAYKYFYKIDEDMRGFLIVSKLNILNTPYSNTEVKSQIVRQQLKLSVNNKYDQLWPGHKNKLFDSKRTSLQHYTINFPHSVRVSFLPLYRYCKGSLKLDRHCKNSQ